MEPIKLQRPSITSNLEQSAAPRRASEGAARAGPPSDRVELHARPAESIFLATAEPLPGASIVRITLVVNQALLAGAVNAARIQANLDRSVVAELLL